MRFPMIAWRNVLRRPTRSLLTVIGVSVAVGSLIALLGLAGGIERTWRASLDERGTHLVVHERGVIELLAGSLPIELGRVIAAVPGVSAVAGELVRMAPLGDMGHAVVSGLEPDAYLWRNLNLIAGRLPSAGETAVAVIGAALAESTGRRVGDRIELMYEPFEVVGIARSSGVLNNNMVHVPIAALAALTQRTAAVTMFSIALADPADPATLAAIRRHLAEVAPRATVVETEAFTRDDRIVGMLRAIARATSLIALVMGLLAVLNTLLMAINERTAEIGLLSAVGWSRVRILALVVLEGLFLTTLGGAAGVAIGLAVARLVVTAPALSAFVEPAITAGLVAEAVLASLVLGFFGALYPAWRATRLAPIEAIQR